MNVLNGYIQKTATSLKSRLGSLFGTDKNFSLQDREQLEEALILSDIGPKTAIRIVDALSQKTPSGNADSQTFSDVAIQEIIAIFNNALPSHDSFLWAEPQNDSSTTKIIVLFGVNGSGKTTSAGKIAHHITQNLKQTVMMAACDTFRAAAVEQLEIWGKRTGVEVVKGASGSDSAGVAFDALKKAQAQNCNWLIVDTAGRLHNQKNLMAELEKIVRVLRKQDPERPLETILVLDGSTGQNALNQARTFHQSVPLSGLLVTKLDGTAKAGILLPLMEELRLPVVAIGAGETLNDLAPFDVHAFARGLIGDTTPHEKKNP